MAQKKKITEFVNEVKAFQKITGKSLCYIYSNNKCLNGKTFVKLIQTGEGVITTDSWDAVREWMKKEVDSYIKNGL
jgi:hypothetical protein